MIIIELLLLLVMVVVLGRCIRCSRHTVYWRLIKCMHAFHCIIVVVDNNTAALLYCKANMISHHSVPSFYTTVTAADLQMTKEAQIDASGLQIQGNSAIL